jgi:hypothetical protein
MRFGAFLLPAAAAKHDELKGTKYPGANPTYYQRSLNEHARGSGLRLRGLLRAPFPSGRARDLEQPDPARAWAGPTLGKVVANLAAGAVTLFEL